MPHQNNPDCFAFRKPHWAICTPIGSIDKMTWVAAFDADFTAGILVLLSAGRGDRWPAGPERRFSRAAR